MSASSSVDNEVLLRHDRCCVCLRVCQLSVSIYIHASQLALRLAAKLWKEYETEAHK